MNDFMPVVKRVHGDKKIVILVVIDDDSISGTLDPDKKPTATIFDFPGEEHDEGDLEHDKKDNRWYGTFPNNTNAPHGYAIVTVFFTTGSLEKTVVPILDALKPGQTAT